MVTVEPTVGVLMDTATRFYDKTEWDGDCLVWTGARTEPRFGLPGYGRFVLGGKVVKAHRWAYRHEVGPIPEGLFVLHRCDNPPCVNVDHLYVGWHDDNAQDRINHGRDGMLAKTHCPQNHPYTGATNSRGHRICPECNRQRCRRDYWRQKGGK